MKYLAIIQARCGSSRLPSKVLMDIGGKTALERMLDRVSRAQKIDEIIVATTLNREDIPIVKMVSGLGYRVFAGSSGDVLDRYYQAAKLVKPDYVIRLTADCPLFDWRVLDEAVDKLLPDTDDLAMFSETFPDGQDLEILRFSTLETMWKKAELASEREHVTLYIRNHRANFKIQDFICSIGNLNSERWTLDEPEDLAMVRAVYKHFLPRFDFSMKEIYEYLQTHPEIRNINRHLVRNEGLLKSLKNDHVVGHA